MLHNAGSEHLRLCTCIAFRRISGICLRALVLFGLQKWNAAWQGVGMAERQLERHGLMMGLGYARHLLPLERSACGWSVKCAEMEGFVGH